jgi:uracil-DNA glycosylase family protein
MTRRAKVETDLFGGPAPRDPAQERSAAAADLGQVRSDAADCRACPLFAHATQTVFGEGPESAEIVFVGEQPGDKEDLAGRPFVGPAGQLFDRALGEAGMDRSVTYVTNAVKHFKFEPRGKLRLHKKPNAGEIDACRWWLSRELALVEPKLVVALGATALQSLVGRAVPVTANRGRSVTAADGRDVFVTVHPSYLLRLPDEATRQVEFQRFVDDLKVVASRLG